MVRVRHISKLIVHVLFRLTLRNLVSLKGKHRSKPLSYFYSMRSNKNSSICASYSRFHVPFCSESSRLFFWLVATLLFLDRRSRLKQKTQTLFLFWVFLLFFFVFVQGNGREEMCRLT